MENLLILTYIIVLILLLITIFNLVKLEVAKEKLIKEQGKLIDVYSKLNKILTNKIINVNLILYSNKTDTEIVEEAKKVIYSSTN